MTVYVCVRARALIVYVSVITVVKLSLTNIYFAFHLCLSKRLLATLSVSR